jgi:hypothetical protein
MDVLSLLSLLSLEISSRDLFKFEDAFEKLGIPNN